VPFHPTHTRSWCSVLALCVLLISTSGCSFLVDGTQSVNITTTQAEAEIFVDGQLVGRGTARVDLAKDDSHLVVAKLGGQSAQKPITKSISLVGVLDIAGGIFFLVPFIGIAAPGFWTLRPTQVNLTVPGGGGSNDNDDSIYLPGGGDRD